MIKLRSDLADEKSWYPPECRAHLYHLDEYCSTLSEDRRNKLQVLTDIDYRAVGKDITGPVRGFSHDRVGGTLKLTIQESGEREAVPIDQIVKFERMSQIPRIYRP